MEVNAGFIITILEVKINFIFNKYIIFILFLLLSGKNKYVHIHPFQILIK